MLRNSDRRLSPPFTALGNLWAFLLLTVIAIGAGCYYECLDAVTLFLTHRSGPDA